MINRRDFIRAAVIASIGAAIAPAAFVETLQPTPAILEFTSEFNLKKVVEFINTRTEWQAYIMGENGLERADFPCKIQYLPLKTMT